MRPVAGRPVFVALAAVCLVVLLPGVVFTQTVFTQTTECGNRRVQGRPQRLPQYNRRVRALSLAVVVLALLGASGCSGPQPPSREEEVRAGDEAVRRADYKAAAAAYGRAAAAGSPDGRLLAKQASALADAWNFEDATDPARRAAELLPGDTEVQLLAARVLLMAKAFEEAVDRMSALVAAQPGNVDALMALGNAAAGLQRSEAAMVVLADARRPQQLTALGAAARPRARRTDARTAEAAFRQALQLRPGYATRLAFANFLLAVDRLEEGGAELRQLVDMYPNRPLLDHALGSLYVWQGRPAEAEPFLARAGVPGYERRGIAVFVLAGLLMDQRRDLDALTVLRTAAVDDVSDNELALRHATLELRTGHTSEGLRRLDALIARKDFDAAIMKARALRVEQPAAAVAAARAAVDARPSSGEARGVLAEALLAAGDVENAFVHYDEATRLEPRESTWAIGLAGVAVPLGRARDVLSRVRDAAHLNDNDPEAALALVRTMAAINDYAGAERELQWLRPKAPESVPERLATGDLMVAQKRWGEARAAFERALQLAPGSVAADGGLIAVDLGEGLLPAALRRAESMLASHPNDPAALWAAATAYAANADAPRTEVMLRRLLAAAPGHVEAAQRLVTPGFTRDHPADARRLLEGVIARRPKALSIRLLLGRLYVEQGLRNLAVEEFQAILAEPAQRATDSISASAAAQLSALRQSQESAGARAAN